MAAKQPKAPKPDDKPAANYVGKLRSYMARMGYDPKAANELVKTAKTARQIANDIAADMRGRQ